MGTREKLNKILKKMEFPDLGKHCMHEGCNRLDFLPVKCVGCKQTYCIDHYQYEKHSCKEPAANREVPTCPLCDKPVPLQKNKTLDRIVSEHIDRACDSKVTSEKRRRRKDDVVLRNVKSKNLFNSNVTLVQRSSA